jgi:hypothetical protein
MKPLTPDEYPWQFAGLSGFYDNGFSGLTSTAIYAALAVICPGVKYTLILKLFGYYQMHSPYNF